MLDMSDFELCQKMHRLGWTCVCLLQADAEQDEAVDSSVPYTDGAPKYWFVSKKDVKFRTWYMRALLVVPATGKEMWLRQR